MTPDALIEAFHLPAACAESQRVPKKHFLDTPGLVTADRKAIQKGIEEVRWRATLLPESIGVAAHESETRRYSRIAIVTVRFAPKAPVPRLSYLIHRCIAHPLLLISEATPSTLSLCHKRLSLAEGGKTVLDDAGDIHTTAPLAPDLPGLASFLATLPVPTAPAADLYHLYQRWITSIIGLAAASVTGTYHAPHSPAEAAVLNDALTEHDILRRDIAALRTRAEREKQLSRRIELNLDIQHLTARLNSIQQSLHRGGGF